MKQKIIKNDVCKKTIKRYSSGDFLIELKYKNGMKNSYVILREELAVMKDLETESVVDSIQKRRDSKHRSKK